jgi:hypothetical protein
VAASSRCLDHRVYGGTDNKRLLVGCRRLWAHVAEFLLAAPREARYPLQPRIRPPRSSWPGPRYTSRTHLRRRRYVPGLTALLARRDRPCEQIPFECAARPRKADAGGIVVFDPLNSSLGSPLFSSPSSASRRCRRQFFVSSCKGLLLPMSHSRSPITAADRAA